MLEALASGTTDPMVLSEPARGRLRQKIPPAYNTFDRGERYRDLGADYFIQRREPAHRAQRLVNQPNSLGYQVTLHQPPTAEPTPNPTPKPLDPAGAPAPVA